MSDYRETERIQGERERLADILRRFILMEDENLSDRDFVAAVIARFDKQRAEEPGDPNA